MGTELLLWIRSCYYGYGQGYVIEEPISALQRYIPKKRRLQLHSTFAKTNEILNGC